MAINKQNNTLSYQKKYLMQERTEQETALSDVLQRLWNSQDVSKDPHFFGRAVGNAIEDCVNTVVKNMEKGKADSKERKSFIEAFFTALTATLRNTKQLHKMRNGE